MGAKCVREIGMVVAGLMISSAALAQTPDIVSFQGNGQLAWTNSNTNLYYQIEWASSLMPSNAWDSSYIPLTDIRSSDAVVTATVPMFYRVTGSSNRSVFATPVAKTGQTNSYTAGDDGAYMKGTIEPTPRFTVGAGMSSNCVTDNLTGLMWLRNSPGKSNWVGAIAYCEGLDGGAGRGGYSDWRLPNIKELQTLASHTWTRELYSG